MNFIDVNEDALSAIESQNSSEADEKDTSKVSDMKDSK